MSRELSLKTRFESIAEAYPLSFFLAMLANLLFFASMHLLMTIMPRYIQEIGGQPSQIGLAIGLFTLSAVLARPAVGYLTDTSGSKRVLMLGAAIFALSPALYTLTRSVLSLMGVRFFHGLGISAFTTAYLVLVADLVPPDRRGEAIGLAGITTPISISIAPAVGEWLLEPLGFIRLFQIAVVLALVSLAVLLLVREPASRDVKVIKPRLPMIQVVRYRGVWVPCLVNVVTAIAYGSVVTFLPLFATQRSLGNVGLFFSAYAVATVLAGMPLGRLSDRVGRRAVGLPALLALGPVFWLLAGTRNLGWLIGVALLFGVSFTSSRVVLNALVVDEAPPEARGAAMSLLFGSFDVGIGVGSFVMGLVAGAAGYGGMYVVVGGVALIGAMIFGVLIRESAVVAQHPVA